MSAFQDGVGLRIANCGESGLDSVGLEQLLEFNANEFGAIVMDAMKWAWVSAEPCSVQGNGDGGSFPVEHDCKFHEVGCHVDDGESQK